jgi:hypothetical protein
MNGIDSLVHVRALRTASVWLLVGLLAAGAGVGPRVLSNAPERVASGPALATAATAWLDSLVPPQAAKARRPFAAPERTDWHFVPRFDRKGLPLRDMTPAQQDLARALLRTALSEAGWTKAQVIMQLEEILRVKPSSSKGKYIKSISIAQTMGPGIDVDPQYSSNLLEEATA